MPIDTLDEALKRKIEEEAWLNLPDGLDESKIFNPFMNIPDSAHEDPHLYMIYVMCNPEYFSFLTKNVLNLDLSPMQLCILQECWARKFPMLIASRGASKTFSMAIYCLLRLLLLPNRQIVVAGAAFRQSKFIFEYMEKIWNNAPMLRDLVGGSSSGRYGPSRDIDMWRFRIFDSTAVFIPIGDGCLTGDTLITYEDKFACINDGSNKDIKFRNKKIYGNFAFNTSDQLYHNGIKDTKIVITKRGYQYEGTYNHKMRVMTEHGIIWKRTDELELGDYILIDRSKRWHNGKTDIREDEAYACGLMVGDGNWTNKYKLGFASPDEELIPLLNQGLLVNFKQSKNDKIHFRVDGKEIRQNFLDRFELTKLYGHEKYIPKPIMRSERNIMSSFLRGLFDADGHVVYNSTINKGNTVYVGFTTTSKKLAYEVQYILLHYGIICSLSYRDRKRKNKQCKRAYELLITGNNVELFSEFIGFTLQRKRDVLTKGLSSKKVKLELENIIPFAKNILYDFIDKHNNIKNSLRPHLKTRKNITFKYFKRCIQPYIDKNINVDSLLKLCNENIFYDIVTDIKESRDDTFDLHVPVIHEYCANGFFSHNSTIRGLRANDIIVDEFACLKAGSIVETTDGFIRIEDFDRCGMLPTGDSHVKYEAPAKFIKTPLTDVYEIKLTNGYVIRCSKIHQVMTSEGWKLSTDIQPGDWIEETRNDNGFQFGKTEIIDSKLAWLLGILVSEGAVKNKNTISITTTDEATRDKLINDYQFKIYNKEAYVDNRGWVCKQSYHLYKTDTKLRNKLYEFGLDYVTAHNKQIPWSILKSPKHIIISFLSGLFDGDGSCFLWDDKVIKNKIGLAYYSVSERLCRDVQFIMNKLGFDGYINNRKSKISDNLQWFVRWNNNIAKDAAVMLNVGRFQHTIENCVVTKEPRNIFFDQNKQLWVAETRYLGKLKRKYSKTLEQAEINLAEFKKLLKYRKVVSVTKLDKQEHLYDYYLPNTNSFYAEGFRQHNSIDRAIFETVISGFGAVSANPIQNMKEAAARKKAIKMDMWKEVVDTDKLKNKSNQVIIAGTAYYNFNHFAHYWRTWHKIIESRGDSSKIAAAFGSDEDKYDKNISYKDFSVIRIPFELIPEGFMDVAQVARSKATFDAGTFDMEYNCIFSKDSNGFYKRTLIEGCVVGHNTDFNNMPFGAEIFSAVLSGRHDKKYVFGIDPASEVDNFAIVIMEIRDTHRRIVHCWTINRKGFKERVKLGLVTENDYYRYCAGRIRDLMERFPTDHIAIDTQGGGYAIMEVLQDTMDGKYQPLLPIINPEKPKDTDGQNGLHILELVNFASADYTRDANHGLRKDLEDRVLLFPYFDGITLAELNLDETNMYDGLEDCVLDIEELKDELASIVVTETASGRQRWDTPEVKISGSKKERARKDRYSALLMANMLARSVKPRLQFDCTVGGGFARHVQNQDNGPLYVGPSWFTNKIQGVY